MTTKAISELRIKIFADGADRTEILNLYQKPYIKGFTTNPTLMFKAGIHDYQSFAKDLLKEIDNCPISFEVLSDDFNEMRRQALLIHSWGENVYVKIPVTNSSGTSSCELIHDLSCSGVKLNVTALMNLEQVREVSTALGRTSTHFISVFAGRIADTGVDPIPLMASALEIMKPCQLQELIWASPRELFNIFQAETIGCHIITLTHDILAKLHLVGKDLAELSLETVQMFQNDAFRAGLTL